MPQQGFRWITGTQDEITIEAAVDPDRPLRDSDLAIVVGSDSTIAKILQSPSRTD